MSDPMWSMQAEQPTSSVVIWEGQAQSLGTMATKGRVVTAKYRLTEDALCFEAGVLSTTAQTIPLWFVADVDLRQSMTQKARGVGDIVVKLDQAVASRFGQNALVLNSIKDPRTVKDLIVSQSTAARRAVMDRQHQRTLLERQAGASTLNLASGAPPQASFSTPSASPGGPSVIEQLKELAQLRDAGVLTEDEFATQKARILA